jgi:hypothetical protein
MTGPVHTFGKNPAAILLHEEASKDPYDLRRVARLMQNYNSIFLDVAEANVDLSMRARIYLLELHRDYTVAKMYEMKWHNRKLVTFLANTIKTKYTVFVREYEERRRAKKVRLKGPPTRHPHCEHAEYGTHVCHDHVEYPLNACGSCDRCGYVQD